MSGYQKIVGNLLSQAHIVINGNMPPDIQVRDKRFYERVMREGSMGLGESYMDGWWDCRRIDELIYRVLKEKLPDKIKKNIKALFYYFLSRIFNLQSRARAGIVARRHYDLGNDLFSSFLDPYLQYSCAFFENTDDLNEAQQKKLDLICRKLNLQAEDHVLDIGCGWGGLARYMTEHYGCEVTAVNISDEQLAFAQEFCKNLPVTFIHQDYREISGNFDKIVSIGMFEHVGYKNYRTFMEICHRCLKDDGIFLLQTIGGNTSMVNCDAWINRYIFPNGMLPSIAQIAKASEGLFVLEDIHNLGPHYHKTLLAWHERFQKAWPKLEAAYGEQFKRMWEYYLLSCAGTFRARDIQIWQIVMTKQGAVQPQCRSVKTAIRVGQSTDGIMSL
ncbi:MAG: cyclopropane fatty acyl phospholipid synthase [Deltaproteobacteria bacterium]|nr:cyclopropane fatty acyl phospholipid synthase [Deltaproteobacteria bacterium]